MAIRVSSVTAAKMQLATAAVWKVGLTKLSVSPIGQKANMGDRTAHGLAQRLNVAVKLC